MTKQMFAAMMTRADCGSKKGSGSTSALPSGRTMTLYLARDGASLQVSRVVELKTNDGMVEAIDNKGELFMLALDDLFATSVSGEPSAGQNRKAGFLS